MQPNQNPIDFDSQGNMLIPSVQSPNYVTGSSGWSVKKDGSAEFNNLTIRGATTVDNISLYYNGTPALGNLVASVAGAQGTDAYGNTYYAGIVAYDNAHGTFVQMVNGEYYAGKQGQNIANIVVVGYGQNSNTELGTDPCAVIEAPTDGVYTSKSAVIAIPGTGSTQATAPTILHVSPNGSQPCNTRISGSVIKTDNFGNSLQWQTPSYAASWGGTTTFNGSTPFNALRYRIDAEDNLWIQGAFTATAAGAGGVVFALPAGSFNPNGQMGFPVIEHQASGTFQTGLGYVSTAGNFHIDLTMNFTRNSGDQYYVNGKVPLGNLA